MASKKKTWREKLADKKDLPKVLILQKRFPCYNAVHKMGAEVGDDIVLVNPSEVVELMKKVPRGNLTTIVEICTSIADKYNVKGCCTLTTGIFIMTAANASEEAMQKASHELSQGSNQKRDRKAHQKDDQEQIDLDIPYWRTLKANGFLNEKYPSGAEHHKVLLEQEGFTVLSKGKKFYVENYKSYVIKPEFAT